MVRCKAPEILMNEAYLGVRRNEVRMRATLQMAVFQQPLSEQSIDGTQPSDPVLPLAVRAPPGRMPS
jgi:hypothetical protein